MLRVLPQVASTMGTHPAEDRLHLADMMIGDHHLEISRIAHRREPTMTEDLPELGPLRLREVRRMVAGRVSRPKYNALRRILVTLSQTAELRRQHVQVSMNILSLVLH